MKKYKALKRGFCGEKLREPGEVFHSPRELYPWAEEIKDCEKGEEPKEQAPELEAPKGKAKPKASRDESVI